MDKGGSDMKGKSKWDDVLADFYYKGKGANTCFLRFVRVVTIVPMMIAVCVFFFLCVMCTPFVYIVEGK